MKRPHTLSKEEGIRCARELKELFLAKGYPIREVRLFGSVAKNAVHRHSDIDIAVLCDPFLDSKHEENTQFLLDSKEVDIRIQTVCLHPNDLTISWWALPREIQKHGIPV